MILSKRYPFGGKPSQQWIGLSTDKRTDIHGWRIGFVPRDTYPQPGEPIIVPMGQIKAFMDDIGIDIAEYIDKKNKKESLRLKVAKMIAGSEIKQEEAGESLDISLEVR